MDDIFNLDIKEEEKPKMKIDEFVNQTRHLITKLLDEYGSAWHDRRITSEEYDKAPCANCKGTGCFINDNDKTVDCVADPEEGECYERLLDTEMFGEMIASEVIEGGNIDIYKLLNAEIIKE